MKQNDGKAEGILALIGAAAFGLWQQSAMAFLFAIAALVFLGSIGVELHEILFQLLKEKKDK